MRCGALRYLLGAVVFIAVYPFLHGGARVWAFDVASFSVAPVIVLGARRRPRDLRTGWLFIAGGQFAFFVGDVLFDVFEHVLGYTPFPSVADIFYLSGYLWLGVGILLLLRQRAHRRQFGALIDAAIVTLGVGVISWVFLIVPYAKDPTLTLTARFVSIAYPLGDLLLLALIVRLVLTPGRCLSDRLLAWGVVANLVADVAYAYLVLVKATTATTAGLDMGWLCGYALLAAAALHRSASHPASAPMPTDDRLSRRRLALLAGAALTAPAILAIQSVSRGTIEGLVIAVTSGVLFLLVMVRIRGLVVHIQAQSATLVALARTDGLTRTLNRRGWDERLDLAISQAARTGQPLWIALLDLDHFKRFNDDYGHPAGDELLRGAAAAWLQQLRSIDTLARYGGEEFGLLLPSCTYRAAAAIIDRLRVATPQQQTFSAGLAQWRPGESPAEVLARADAALYQAKRDGRNRTHCEDATARPPGPDARGTPPSNTAQGAAPHPFHAAVPL